MLNKWRIGLLVLSFTVFSSLPAGARYAAWQDPEYDFTSVKTVYLEHFDFSMVKLRSFDGSQAMETYWRKKGEAFSKVTILQPPMEVPRALLPGQGVENAGEQNKETTTLPKTAAKRDPLLQIPAQAAQAELYLTARLDTLGRDSVLVPAHTEWRTTEVEDGYFDAKGHYHSLYHTITYPEYVPSYYVPYITVGAVFNAYDTKTGKLVLSSEDIRTRGDETHSIDIYKRIVDRFFKNFKTTLKAKGKVAEITKSTDNSKTGKEQHGSDNS